MEKKQVKSRERVAAHGEVFTAEREVKAMCDLVKPETERIDSRFLEPACGDGNFLAEILSRKLACEQIRKYRKSSYDWERNSLLALGSLYGVDILADNCEACVSGCTDCGRRNTIRSAKRSATTIRGRRQDSFLPATLSAAMLCPLCA